MAEAYTCPKCGALLAGGNPETPCPACLMQLGLASWNARGGEAATLTPGDALSPAELAPLFPGLEILDLLGQGGMGAVYKARQVELDRLVALKIIRPQAADEAGFADRFAREARVLARLNHPHIVTIHDFGRREHLYYLVMEYVDGANLRELMRSGRMTSSEALTIVPRLCEALQYAHDEGVVHRDIKPENILLDRKGRVKIADFGLAKLATRPADDVSLTGTRQIVGTPRYMAPEQMQGSRGVDHRADIYSLGVVFYEMLTGELPIGRFEPPSHRVQVDVRLDEVVLRALERDPQRRYQRAGQIKTDVESISHTGRDPVVTGPSTGPHRQPLSGVPGNARAPHDQGLTFPAVLTLLVGAAQLLITCGLSMMTVHEVRSSQGEAVAVAPLKFMMLIVAAGGFAGIAAIVGAAIYLIFGSRQALGVGAAALLFPGGITWLMGLPVGIWTLRQLSRSGAARPADSAAPRHDPQRPDLPVGPPIATSPNELETEVPATSDPAVPWSGLSWVQRASRRMSRRGVIALCIAAALMLGIALILVRNFGGSALLSAARNGNATTTTFWLTMGANPNAHDAQGMTALMWASSEGWDDVVRALTAHGANVRFRTPNAETALMIAAGRGHVDIVNSLLSRGPQANDQDSSGQTPLLRAAASGHYPVVQTLVDHGATVDLPANDGMTPLMFAARAGHSAIVGYLLERGASVSQKTRQGETALMQAAYGGDTGAVGKLLSYGALVNEADIDGETALMLAADRGHAAVIDQLVAKQADTKPISRRGETALSAAIAHGHTAAIEALLKAGAVESPHLWLFRGFLQARSGQYETAATLLENAAKGAWGSFQPAFAVDNWRYEIQTPANYARLLAAECRNRLQQKDQATTDLRDMLDGSGGTGGAAVSYRRLGLQSDHSVQEQFTISRNEVNLHLSDISRPWHAMREYERNFQSAGRSSGQQGSEWDAILDPLR